MAIKMRLNKKEKCVCDECGASKDKVLDMFDISIFGGIYTICDECNDKLFHKTLNANMHTQSRLKSNKDIKITEVRRIKNRKDSKGLSIAEALRGTKGE